MGKHFASACWPLPIELPCIWFWPCSCELSCCGQAPCFCLLATANWSCHASGSIVLLPSGIVPNWALWGFLCCFPSLATLLVVVPVSLPMAGVAAIVSEAKLLVPGLAPGTPPLLCSALASQRKDLCIVDQISRFFLHPLFLFVSQAAASVDFRVLPA